MENRLDHEGTAEHRNGQITPPRNNMHLVRTLKERLADKRNVILLVATLITTITFQAAMNPPGGVWQDDLTVNSQGSPVPNPHKAGDAVMAYKHPHSYATFYIAVLIGFIASLSTIFMVITALRSSNKSVSGVLIMALIGVMCLTFISVLVIVAVSIAAITPEKVHKEIRQQTGITFAIIASCILMISPLTALVAFCFLIPHGAVDENHANGGDEEVPQVQAGVNHANGGDEEVPQVEAGVNHDNGGQAEENHGDRNQGDSEIQESR